MSFEKWIEQVFEQLRPQLNLSEWRVRLKFVKKIKPHSHIPEPGGYTAEMQDDPVYQDVDVSISDKVRKRFEEGNYAWIIEDMCHELVHVHLGRYFRFTQDLLRESDDRTKFTDVEENTCQKFTKILIKYVKVDVPNKIIINTMAIKKTKKPKLGSGKRFAALAKSAGGGKKGAAIAASAGRKKYGAKKMAKMATAGKKKANGK